MSFFMVHLHVAAAVYDRLRSHMSLDRRAMLLGALAPDAITSRPGCVRADKCRTHFTPPGYAWAAVTDNEAWTQCLHDGLLPYADCDNPNFLLGYRVHVLTDIANNRRFWMPMQKLDKMALAVWEADFLEHEARLLADFGGEDTLFPLLTLTSADAFLGDLATADDMARMLAFIKTDLYHHRLPNPAHCYAVITLADITDFITQTADAIAASLLQEVSK